MRFKHLGKGVQPIQTFLAFELKESSAPLEAICEFFYESANLFD
jgi:hypothetical protein